MRANGPGDEEVVLRIGYDIDMHEEVEAAGRKPAAANKGGVAQ